MICPKEMSPVKRSGTDEVGGVIKEGGKATRLTVQRGKEQSRAIPTSSISREIRGHSTRTNRRRLRTKRKVKRSNQPIFLK